MKNHLLAVWGILVSGTFAFGQIADTYVTQGRAALAAHDLVTANNSFASALAVSPNHATANVFRAATRLLVLPNQPAGSALMNRLGVSTAGRNIYNWTATVPQDTNGIPLAPANTSASILSGFIRTNALLEIIGAEGNLAAVTDTNFTLSLTPSETTTIPVTLDYGDLLMMRAGLKFAEYACYTVYSWNLDAQLSSIRSVFTSGTGTAESFLAQYPSLLTFATTNDLFSAQQAFSNAASLYVSASSFIRARPTSAPRLFNYDPGSVQKEQGFREGLTNVQHSLSGPYVLTFNTNVTINASRHFTGLYPPRAFMPRVSRNAAVAGTLPDPTLGGMLFGIPDYEEEAALGKRIPFVSQFEAPQRLSGGRFQITLDALENSFFIIQTSTNLLNWTNLTTAVAHQGIVSFSDTNSVSGAHRFYRALDQSRSFSLQGMVKDLVTGNPISHAQVVLSFDYGGAVTNFSDAAGNFLLVTDIPDGSYYYYADVSASGYGSSDFDGYLPDGQHASVTVYLGVPGYVPANDNFAQRQVLSGATVSATGSNVGATYEPGDFYWNGHSVWWSWTAPISGPVSIDTIGSSFPAYLAVFTGTDLTNLVVVAEADPFSTGLTNSVNFVAAAGTTYQISVGSVNGSAGRIALNIHIPSPLPPTILQAPSARTVVDGASVSWSVNAVGTSPLSYQWWKDGTNLLDEQDSFLYRDLVGTNDAGIYTVVVTNVSGSVTSAPARLTVVVIPPPPNDNFSSRIAISGSSAFVIGNNFTATTEAGEPDQNGQVAGKSVWWTWTAPTSGDVSVDTSGSSFDTALGVYTGNSVSALTEVAFDAEYFTFGTPYSAGHVIFPALAGTNYQIAVDGFYGEFGGDNGSIELRLSVIPQAPPPTVLMFNVVHSFSADTNGNPDGAYPQTSLVQGVDGRLYGVAVNGGTNDIGTIFAVFRNGTGFSVLHTFGSSSQDGSNPSGPLVQGPDGRLYGTAESGGTNQGGTVFSLNTNGTGFTVLHSFPGTSTNNDGANPDGGVIIGQDGRLYGTAISGGIYGGGTAFALNTNGTGFTVLHPFDPTYEGSQPYGPLVQGGDTAFYGTTSAGGPDNSGTVFAFSAFGAFSKFGIFHFFSTLDPTLQTNLDGAYPNAGLLIGRDGQIYGTTSGGGTNGSGTVFAIQNGTFKVLHTFAAVSPAGTNADGATPYGGLVQGNDGRLYGTTTGGGLGAGTLFSLTTNGGSFAVARAFSAPDLLTETNADGGYDYGSLMLDNDGNFYGTTSGAGTNGSGTVFGLIVTPPALRFQLSQKQAVLSWPSWASSFGLETTGTLSNQATWLPVFGGVTNQDYVKITNGLPGKSAFYRLKKN
jgi:uncharacterized repeat protein (TIGR03803 family)